MEVDIRSETLGPIFGELAVTVRERGSGKVVGHRSSNARYARDKTPEGRPNLIAQVTKTLRLTLDAPPQPWSEFNPARIRGRVAAGSRGPARPDRSGGHNIRLPRNGRSRYAIYIERPAAKTSRHAGMRHLSPHRLSALRRAVVAADLSHHEILWPELHPFPFLVPAGGRLRRRRHRRRDDPGRRPAGQHFRRARTPRAMPSCEQELQRMVRTYGNHPSFCLMTLGNEYGGKDAVLIALGRHADPGRPAAPVLLAVVRARRRPTANTPKRRPRGIHGPGTDGDFRGGDRQARPAADRPRDRPVDLLPQLRRNRQVHRRACRPRISRWSATI